MKRIFIFLLLAGCVSGREPFYISHAAPPSGGAEWHSCLGGGACREGWACAPRGRCEWCGPGITRCTEGND
jgi:hypothetical protein